MDRQQKSELIFLLKGIIWTWIRSNEICIDLTDKVMNRAVKLLALGRTVPGRIAGCTWDQGIFGTVSTSRMFDLGTKGGDGDPWAKKWIPA